MLAVEPGARGAFSGSTRNQRVELGAALVGQAVAILEQRPAKPLEARVGALAGCTTACNSKPTVLTRMCLFLPLIFLPASYPCMSIFSPLFQRS
jgi:hypothetical protein